MRGTRGALGAAVWTASLLTSLGARAGEPEPSPAGAEEATAEPADEGGAEDLAGPAPAPPPPAPPAPSLAIDLGQGFVVTPNAQYRLRYRHHEGHDFAAGGVTETFRHRARLGLDLSFRDRVGVFVQVQDVRLYGEEQDTLGDWSADGFDLHQGYGRVVPTEGLELRFGRQEIAFENQRLIGTVGFVEQARSFDALRLKLDGDAVQLDAFYAKVGEDASSTINADGAPLFPDDKDLIAATLHVDPIEQVSVGVVAVADLNSISGRKLYTTGGLLGAKLPAGISLGAEGYYQFGRAYGDVTHHAFMLAAQAKVAIDVVTKPFLQAFGEFASGDDTPNDTIERSFDTLYATNHKFYGEADFFLNLPVHTAKRGLRDIGGRVGFSPVEPLSVQATYHWFSAMAVQEDGLENFGHEIDAKVVVKPWKPFSFDLAYALFVPGDIFRAGVTDPIPEHFVYSTADVTF